MTRLTAWGLKTKAIFLHSLENPVKKKNRQDRAKFKRRWSSTRMDRCWSYATASWRCLIDDKIDGLTFHTECVQRSIGIKKRLLLGTETNHPRKPHLQTRDHFFLYSATTCSSRQPHHINSSSRFIFYISVPKRVWSKGWWTPLHELLRPCLCNSAYNVLNLNILFLYSEMSISLKIQLF